MTHRHMAVPGVQLSEAVGAVWWGQNPNRSATSYVRLKKVTSEPLTTMALGLAVGTWDGTTTTCTPGWATARIERQLSRIPWLHMH